MLQATRWRSQHALQRISTSLGDSLEAGQVGGLAFLREEQLDCSIAKVFKQGDNHSGRLIRAFLFSFRNRVSVYYYKEYSSGTSRCQ
jgi:hypothetical protein